mgnify:CR=1 FL=1
MTLLTFSAGKGSDANQADPDRDVIEVFQYDGDADSVESHSGSDRQSSAPALRGRDLLLKLVDAWRSGVREIHVYPAGIPGEEPVNPACIDLQMVLDEASLAPEARLTSPNSSATEDLLNVVLYHCQKCGAVVERRAGHASPACCGEEMLVAGHDSMPSAE